MKKIPVVPVENDDVDSIVVALRFSYRTMRRIDLNLGDASLVICCSVGLGDWSGRRLDSRRAHVSHNSLVSGLVATSRLNNIFIIKLDLSTNGTLQLELLGVALELQCVAIAVSDNPRQVVDPERRSARVAWFDSDLFSGA